MTTTTTSVGCKGWMKARCGYSSCSKLIDHEREKQKHSDRAGLSRRQSSRAKLAAESNTWERESEWSMLPEVEKEVVTKKLTLRRKRGHKKSSKLTPSSALSPSDRIQIITPDGKCSLRDPYADVREAAKYNSPALIPLEVGGGNAGRLLLTDVAANAAEELRIQPWKRTTFSCPSSDNEPFPTSVDLEGKQRKKKWTSNSSDDTECRTHRGNGSYSRSKSTWSRDSTLTVAEVEEQQQEANAGETRTCRVKKGSKIIFLSSPPGLSSEDDDEQAAPGSAVKCSTEDYGEDYAKLETVIIKNKGSRLDKTLTASCEANQPPSSLFTGVFDANKKEWSKLDRRKSKQGQGNESSIRELGVMVPTSKEPRHIDVHSEDQICRIESHDHDASDSSQGKSHSLRSSRRHSQGEQLASNQFQDQEKPLKKRSSTGTSTSGRRRKGRSRSKAPPPLLPNDLHGKVKESVAVVKSSYDPYNDFRTSMVEMIVEKEIQGAGDLEELLRCYLSLNSTEYHSVIVKVFADVWRELFSDNL